MVGRSLSLLLVVLVLLSVEVRAQGLTRCQEKDLPTDSDGILRAFEGPDSKESEVAVKRIIVIFALALSGLILFFIFWAYFYEPQSGITKPTEVKRGKNYVPYKPQSEPKNTRYHIDDE